MKIRKFFQKNFEKRSAKWSPEKKEKRLKIREGAFSALKIAATVVDVPTGGKVSAVMNLTNEVIDSAVVDKSKPEFTEEISSILKDPLLKKSTELAKGFIDLIEAETGVEIPERLERRIVEHSVDVVADQFDELVLIGQKKMALFFKKAIQWIKGLFQP